MQTYYCFILYVSRLATSMSEFIVYLIYGLVVQPGADTRKWKPTYRHISHKSEARVLSHESEARVLSRHRLFEFIYDVK